MFQGPTRKFLARIKFKKKRGGGPCTLRGASSANQLDAHESYPFSALLGSQRGGGRVS